MNKKFYTLPSLIALSFLLACGDDNKKEAASNDNNSASIQTPKSNASIPDLPNKIWEHMEPTYKTTLQAENITPSAVAGNDKEATATIPEIPYKNDDESIVVTLPSHDINATAMDAQTANFAIEIPVADITIKAPHFDPEAPEATLEKSGLISVLFQKNLETNQFLQQNLKLSDIKVDYINLEEPYSLNLSLDSYESNTTVTPKEDGSVDFKSIDTSSALLIAISKAADDTSLKLGGISSETILENATSELAEFLANNHNSSCILFFSSEDDDSGFDCLSQLLESTFDTYQSSFTTDLAVVHNQKDIFAIDKINATANSHFQSAEKNLLNFESQINLSKFQFDFDAILNSSADYVEKASGREYSPSDSDLEATKKLLNTYAPETLTMEFALNGIDVQSFRDLTKDINQSEAEGTELSKTDTLSKIRINSTEALVKLNYTTNTGAVSINAKATSSAETADQVDPSTLNLNVYIRVTNMNALLEPILEVQPMAAMVISAFTAFGKTEGDATIFDIQIENGGEKITVNEQDISGML